MPDPMLQPAGLLTLFVAMVVLAALPSVDALTVIARSVSLGWRHGAATGLGIVLADLLFILLAINELGLIATQSLRPVWPSTPAMPISGSRREAASTRT